MRSAKKRFIMASPEDVDEVAAVRPDMSIPEQHIANPHRWHGRRFSSSHRFIKELAVQAESLHTQMIKLVFLMTKLI